MLLKKGDVQLHLQSLTLFRWVNDCKWICEHSLTKCFLSNQKPASDLPVPPTVYWHPSLVALLHGYFCYVGWENILFFLIFHGIICSHILNWTSVIVFSEWRIFLHFLCDHCVFSLQVSASSLRTPPTQYVECWISKCDCNHRVCFQSVTVTFQCFCLTPVLQHPGKQPCQFVCAADHSKVRSSSAAHSYSQFSTFLHAHTTC